VKKGVGRLESVLPELEELALGGTAVGSGLNAPEGFPAAVIADMAAITGYPLREADDHFEAQAAKDAAVNASGALKTVAQSLFKIANDLRWMSSGPRTGLSEIRLPSLQPGSSIMPGKVNPVMPEMMMQVAAQVIGNDTAVTWGGANGNFELNVMMPLIAHNLLQSIALLTAASDAFAERAVAGIEADVEHSRELVERNIIVVTALNPHIGYDRGAEAAKEAFTSGRNVRDVVVEKGWLTADQVDELLDLKRMTEGGVIG
jgi:fumarate hydratase class II